MTAYLQKLCIPSLNYIWYSCFPPSSSPLYAWNPAPINYAPAHPPCPCATSSPPCPTFLCSCPQPQALRSTQQGLVLELGSKDCKKMPNPTAVAEKHPEQSRNMAQLSLPVLPHHCRQYKALTCTLTWTPRALVAISKAEPTILDEK